MVFFFFTFIFSAKRVMSAQTQPISWWTNESGIAKCNELMESIELMPSADRKHHKRTRRALTKKLGPELTDIVMQMLAPYRLTTREREIFRMDDDISILALDETVSATNSMCNRQIRTLLVVQDKRDRPFPVFAFYEHSNSTRYQGLNKDIQFSGICEIYDGQILLEGEGTICRDVKRPFHRITRRHSRRVKMIEHRKCFSKREIDKMVKCVLPS